MTEEKAKLTIPAKLKVGFQNREGTYTGKLAYVVYYDNKNVLRKEKSWQSWRDKAIDPLEISNEPTEGFVLNKDVGGYKSDWNYRSSHIRVWDPRDFEFEISVENLLFILRECNCSKGKGLEGKFVYAWDKTELVLLPVSSENYKNSIEFTKLQSQNVKIKELVLGTTYLSKDMNMELVYLGYHQINSIIIDDDPSVYTRYHHLSLDKKGKMHVFYKALVNEKEYVYDPFENTQYFFTKDTKKLAKAVSNDIRTDYAQLAADFSNSKFKNKIASMELKRYSVEEISNFGVNDYRKNYSFIEISPNTYSKVARTQFKPRNCFYNDFFHHNLEYQVYNNDYRTYEFTLVDGYINVKQQQSKGSGTYFFLNPLEFEDFKVKWLQMIKTHYVSNQNRYYYSYDRYQIYYNKSDNELMELFDRDYKLIPSDLVVGNKLVCTLTSGTIENIYAYQV